MSSPSESSLDDLISSLMDGIEIPEDVIIEGQLSSALNNDIIPNFNVDNMLDFLNGIDVEDLYETAAANSGEDIDFDIQHSNDTTAATAANNPFLLCSKCSYPCFSHEHLKRHKKNCDKNANDKEYACSSCSHRFSSKKNCELHEQRCCSTATNTCRKRQSTAAAAAAGTSAEAQIPSKKPNIHQPSSTSRKLLVQDGGSTTSTAEQHPETWKIPTLHESAFKGKVMTYKKDFDHNVKINFSERLKNVFHFYKMELDRKLAESPTKAWKYYFSLVCNFHKLELDEVVTDPPVVFRSEVFVVNNDNLSDIIHHMEIAQLQLWHQIEEFQKNGRGWVIDCFISLDMSKYTTCIFLL